MPLRDHAGAPFAVAGRLLALLAAESERPLSLRALVSGAGGSPSEVGTLLEWLAELGLASEYAAGEYRLGPMRSRAARAVPLLLHLEQDAEIGSVCHALFTEHGYPLIGVLETRVALQLAAAIEFDLALLSAEGESAAAYAAGQRELLDRLQPAPVVLYGVEDGGAWLPVVSPIMLLPGPPHYPTMLEMVRSLLR